MKTYKKITVPQESCVTGRPNPQCPYYDKPFTNPYLSRRLVEVDELPDPYDNLPNPEDIHM